MRIAFTRIPEPEIEEIDRTRHRRLKAAAPAKRIERSHE